MPIIKLKRGQKEDLPSTGSAGEPHFTTDTKELFIADESTFLHPVKTMSDNIIDKGNANGVAALDLDTNVTHHIKTSNLFFHSTGETTVHYNQNIIIESLPISEFRLVTWIINVADQETGEFYSCQLSAHHNGTTADYAIFAMIGVETVEFNVVVEGPFLRLYGLSNKDFQVVRTITTAIRFM